VEGGRTCVVLRGEEGGGGGRAEGEEELEELLRGSACGCLFFRGRGEERRNFSLTDVVVGAGHVQDGVAVFVACFAEWGCAEAVDEGVDVV